MGEFHYTRYPERYWEEEILKMKAGGVQDHRNLYFSGSITEEVEGQFDWSGQRNLREFRATGAPSTVLLRLSAHRARGRTVKFATAGLPDWLLKKGPTRVNDPIYLSYVRKYYDEVGRQLKGLLWN